MTVRSGSGNLLRSHIRHTGYLTVRDRTVTRMRGGWHRGWHGYPARTAFYMLTWEYTA